MKRAFLYCLFIVSALSSVTFAGAQNANAPTLKPAENTMDEILGMLRLMGTQAWRFDLSEFSDAEYRFNPYIVEYVEGKEVVENDNIELPKVNMPSNWRKRYPDPDQWSKFVEERNPKLSADGEKFLVYENMAISLAKKDDSTQMVNITLYGAAMLSLSLPLKPLQNTEEQPRYLYDCRPFKIESFESFESGSRRIPLLLLGSFWWDERIKNHRFCGVSKFAPDMSDKEDLGQIPHYYVIGVEVEKTSVE